jgi:hypothetical protein
MRKDGCALKELLYKENLKKMQLQRAMNWMCGIVLFYAIVCTPVFLWISSDILISATVLPLLWETLMSVCNYLFYWIALATLLYAVIRFGIADSKRYFVSFAVLSAIRYFLNYLSARVVLGFPSVNDFFTDDLLYILLDVVFDFALMAIAVLLIHTVVKSKLSYEATEQERSSFFAMYFPISSVFDINNPIAKAALYAAIVPSAFKLLSRLIYDFSYGAPRGLVDLLWMVSSYVLDLLALLVGYVLLVMLVSRTYQLELKIKSEFESN